MKKFLALCCTLSMLMLTVVPAFAEFSVTGDLASGNYQANYMDGVEREPSSDVVGGVLGLGYNYHNWLVNFDYVYGDLDRKIIGDDALSLGDLRVGYRFFNTDSLNASALLFYIADANGVFKAPAVGLGAEYFFNDKWSIDGRIGYSPAGVDVDSYVSTYEDAAVVPVAIGLNYRVSDSWSFNTAYRYYAFTGETNGTDLESKIQLASVGLTCKLGAKQKPEPTKEPEATPAPTETPKATPVPTATAKPTPVPTETPKATPAPTTTAKPTPVPTETPKATPVPAATAKPTPVPTETSKATPVPTATAKPTPTPTETPKATPAPTTTVKPEVAIKEREESLNQFLQPVFFNFDSASIRPNQVPVLENNLKILKEASDLNILIGGHADQKGTSEYNKKLSQKRAENVRTWLINHGISAQRIKVAAYGSQNPYFHRTKDPKWESDRWVDTIVAIDVPGIETGIRK